jgi:tetratricopeptide (TPR) repeat protein
MKGKMLKNMYPKKKSRDFRNNRINHFRFIKKNIRIITFSATVIIPTLTYFSFTPEKVIPNLLALPSTFSSIQNFFQKNKNKDNILILVANFHSPTAIVGYDKNNTDNLNPQQTIYEQLDQLNSINKNYNLKSNKIFIDKIDDNIKINDEERAIRELNRRVKESGYKLGLIIWDEYSGSKSKLKIFSKIKASEQINENYITTKFSATDTIAELDEYTLQEDISKKNMYSVLLLLGSANSKSGEYQIAHNMFDEAIERATNLKLKPSVAYHLKAFTYHIQNEFPLAIKYYKFSLKGNIDNPILVLSYQNLAILCIINDPKNCLIEDLNLGKLHKYTEKSKSNEYMVVNLQNSLNRYPYAISNAEILLEKALSLDAEKTVRSITYNNRGMLFLAKKQIFNAIDDFGKAIELDEKNSMAYVNRGATKLLCFWEKLEQIYYDRAKEDLRKAIEYDPDNFLAYLQLGQLERIKSNPSSQDLTDGQYYTKIAIEKMKKLGKDDLEAQISLADFYSKKGNKELALQTLDDLKINHPKSPYLYFNRGLFFQETGDYDNSLREFDTAINLKQDYFDAYRGSVETLVYRLGEESAEKKLNSQGASSKDYILRAMYYYLTTKEKEKEKILNNLEKALAMESNDEVKLQLGSLKPNFESLPQPLCN